MLFRSIRLDSYDSVVELMWAKKCRDLGGASNVINLGLYVSQRGIVTKTRVVT